MEHDWRELARCRGMDPTIFMPARGQDDRPAKRVCETCPVTEPCAEYAMRDASLVGVWGGLSEKQRRRIRQQGRSRVEWFAQVAARRRTVGELFDRGLSRQQIAERLQVSVTTVSSDRAAVAVERKDDEP